MTKRPACIVATLLASVTGAAALAGNESRSVAYPYMDPTLVDNGIQI